MVNNMCEAKPTTDWETRFKQAYEEFQAEKKYICSAYEVKIAEMKQVHCKEIEAMAARCADKELEVSELKRRANMVYGTVAMYAEQAIAQDETPECGYVELTNSTCYQDFIGILINNGYTVQIEPLNNGNRLGITIKESEEE